MKIKFCGITSLKDYEYIVKKGADYTGFIFFKKSKRYISPNDAKSINVEGFNNKRVGVFVNESIDNIRQIYVDAKLDIVQLHGDESEKYCESLGLPYWKVFRIKSAKDISNFKKYSCSTILIDTYSKKDYGGTGESINIELIQLAIDEAKKLEKNIIVAGGLNIDNIETVLQLAPFGVDINSGVEIEPGIKDLNKVKNIIEIIRG